MPYSSPRMQSRIYKGKRVPFHQKFREIVRSASRSEHRTRAPAASSASAETELQECGGKAKRRGRKWRYRALVGARAVARVSEVRERGLDLSEGLKGLLGRSFENQHLSFHVSRGESRAG